VCAKIQFGSHVHMLLIMLNEKVCENSIRLPYVYAPYAKRKNLYIHLHNLYAFVKVSRKNDIAYNQCKKDKTCTIKCLLVSIKIYLFYVGQTTSRFFIKWLCTHTICEDVRVNFSFEFFWYFKIYQILHSNNRSICTWKPKQQSVLFSYIIHSIFHAGAFKLN
jgi:hypothetical protein